MSADKSILVAVDFAHSSTRALSVAIDLAKRLGAPLDIVHACPPPPAEYFVPDDEVHYVVKAREQLAALVAVAARAGVVAHAHLKLDAPVFAIMEASDELEPLVVVVGSHGRRGVARALIGSISESLARRSRLPVMIVPAQERARLAEATAWACASCGHILGDGEERVACVQCGTDPASWTSAAISEAPVDIAEPAVGEYVAPDLGYAQTQGPSSLFSTSPPGVEGVEPNAELRVRY
jgi:nucleotide-binding universal stress UspA family protein